MNQHAHLHTEYLLLALDVANPNTEFGTDFVFFDMPSWQQEYANDCVYQSFYQQLIEKVDFTYVIWDVSHGKVDQSFADFQDQRVWDAL